MTGKGGRVLGSGVPKYLNSPQTPIFDKSSILFGLDHARQGIRAAGEAVIVEEMQRLRRKPRGRKRLSYAAIADRLKPRGRPS